jgi:hypothetical protein
MFGFVFRLAFGLLGVLFGTSIIIWVLYNYVVERQPEFSGPRFFSGFGGAIPMLTVGIYWLRNLRRKPGDKSGHDA